jgi:predicted MPP superfamily phosphohydrolase
MLFFLIAFTIFGSAYGFVGWRMSTAAGPLTQGTVWGLLLFHFVATFVSFALLRQVGPTAATRPLFWFVYCGMGVFSFVFAGLLFAELGWAGVRLFEGISGETVLNDERRRFLFGAIQWGVVLAAGLGSAWGVRAARRSPDVVEVDVPIVGLPSALDGYRIAQISDLHVGPTIGADFARTVVNTVNALQPDMIALTGDLVDGSVEHLSDGVAPLGELTARDGVFFVTGNHEYYSGVRAWCKKMAELGAKVLLNSHVVVTRGNAKLLVAGVTDHSAGRMIPSHKSDPGAALAGSPVCDVKLLLAHQPKSSTAAKPHSFDLQLSGHTHGGQMFPWNLLVGLVHPFSRGLYRFGAGWVYVNRGTGYWGPPMRVGVPSEITLLTLRQPTVDG